MQRDEYKKGGKAAPKKKAKGYAKGGAVKAGSGSGVGRLEKAGKKP